MPRSSPEIWHVYILRCGDGTLYTGIAKDPEARLALHAAGRGARYTRGRGPFELVHLEKMVSRTAALRRELAIKRLTREDKLRLIQVGMASSQVETSP